jgi:hypothetical protein
MNKLKVSIFGESSDDKILRTNDLEIANSYLESVLNKGKYKEVLASGQATPITSLGLG